jgi:hypothetical protein
VRPVSWSVKRIGSRPVTDVNCAETSVHAGAVPEKSTRSVCRPAW